MVTLLQSLNKSTSTAKVRDEKALAELYMLYICPSASVRLTLTSLMVTFGFPRKNARKREISLQKCLLHRSNLSQYVEENLLLVISKHNLSTSCFALALYLTNAIVSTSAKLFCHLFDNYNCYYREVFCFVYCV